MSSAYVSSGTCSAALLAGPCLRNEVPGARRSVSFCSSFRTPSSSFASGCNSRSLMRIRTNTDHLAKCKSSSRSCRSRILALVKGVDYEFFEEGGGSLEVRVRLPLDGHYTARQVAVDTQASSLCVGVRTPEGVKILMNASSLYGRIQPHETVWFVDEEEVVLSLKKADREQVWPDLVQEWQSLAKGVASQLQGASVYIVGESTEVNWSVAQELAAALEYVPLKTEQLIQDLASTTVSRITEEEGEDALAGCERAVINTLSQHVRCVVSTLGGNGGAASRQDGWNGLYSGFAIWISQIRAQDEESAKEEVVRARQDGILAYSKADVVVGLPGWDADAARPTAEGALKALKQLLDAEKDLPGKKSLYVRLGCRGDWPNIMPPGWDPDNPQDTQMQAQSMVL